MEKSPIAEQGAQGASPCVSGTPLARHESVLVLTDSNDPAFQLEVKRLQACGIKVEWRAGAKNWIPILKKGKQFDAVIVHSKARQSTYLPEQIREDGISKVLIALSNNRATELLQRGFDSVLPTGLFVDGLLGQGVFATA